VSGTCLDRALDVEMSVLAVEACAKRADVAGIAKVQRADVCISAARRDCLFFVCVRYDVPRAAVSRRSSRRRRGRLPRSAERVVILTVIQL